MYEEMEKHFVKMGGTILKNHNVVKINNNKNKIDSIVCTDKDNNEVEIKGDIFISSMAIKDLVEGMDKVPNNIYDIAVNLPYRDFVTIGLVLDKLKIKNNTKINTLNNIVPDTWIYIQSSDVKMGRIQVFNNWSPYLVKNVQKSVSLGLEYFCYENDELWNSSDEKLRDLAFNELVNMGIIEDNSKVLNYHVERVLKAYPAYFDSYKEFDVVKEYLNTFDNLYCIGRNGQHRYNNMDHSMMTAIVCINNILEGRKDKENIWSVNTEEVYHEEKDKEENR